MPALRKATALGWLLFVSLSAVAETAPVETPELDLLEFLGSVDTDDTSSEDILTVIETGLHPVAPEELLYETK